LISFYLLLRNQFSAILLGQQQICKFNEINANLVNIYLWILRLPEHRCDVLVTFNDPIAINPASSSAKSATAPSNQQENLASFEKMIQSFKINDYSLFST
jgi:hypothetical protein